MKRKRFFTRYTLEEYVRKVMYPIRNVVTFTEVHFHATDRPSIADFRRYPGEHYMQSMYRAHLARGFNDTAQHATVDPDGFVWDGRSLLEPPASATGFNNSSKDRRHPFMFEVIGQFDKGNELLEGPQLETSIGLCKAVMQQSGKGSEMVKFHREMTDQKTCPGSGIDKAWIIELIDRKVDLPMTPEEREMLATVHKELAVLKKRASMPCPTWAIDAVESAVKEEILDTPDGASYDVYRILTILYRRGLI